MPLGEPKKFAALEGWRGVCALFVAVMHVGQVVPWHLGKLPIFANAYLFVDFFFVLSGFVITWAYRSRIGGPSDIASFAIRRFGRLWPLHVFVLGIFVGLECLDLLLRWQGNSLSAHAPFTATRTPEGLLGNLLFLQGLVPWRGAIWNLPSWTISVEFWVYLVFAGTCLVASRRQIWLRAALAVFGFVMVVADGRYMSVACGFGLFRCAYGFFLGSLVCNAFGSKRRTAPAYPSLLEVFAAGTVVVFVSVAGARALSLAAPLVFAGVVYIFGFEGGVLSRIFSSRPMARLGAWSYSIYLVHYAVFLIVLTTLRSVARHLGYDYLATLQAGGELPNMIVGNPYLMDLIVVVYVGTVIGIASMTYRYIETPWRQRFNALAARIKTGVGAADVLRAASN